MEVMFSYQKVDQWSPPLSDQQGRAQSRSGCWAGLGHNWPWGGVIMATWNQSIFIIATFFTIRLPLVCTHISWHDKTFHDHLSWLWWISPIFFPRWKMLQSLLKLTHNNRVHLWLMNLRFMLQYLQCLSLQWSESPQSLSPRQPGP